MPRDLPSRMPSERSPRRISGAVCAAALIAALSACSPPAPAAVPSSSASPSAPTPSAAAPGPTEASEPALVPDGTADDNLPLFTAVTAAIWASESRVAGRAYVDALTEAGFDKAQMQVTEDQSTVGNPAESIQFSVRWGEECLIGQVGPATGAPVTAVMPVLAEGSCLIGETRAIDW